MLFLYCKKKKKEKEENIIDVITLCMSCIEYIYDIHLDEIKMQNMINRKFFISNSFAILRHNPVEVCLFLCFCLRTWRREFGALWIKSLCHLVIWSESVSTHGLVLHSDQCSISCNPPYAWQTDIYSYHWHISTKRANRKIVSHQCCLHGNKDPWSQIVLTSSSCPASTRAVCQQI